MALFELNEAVTLGRTPVEANPLRSTLDFVAGRMDQNPIYVVLQRKCFTSFPDKMFADLFTDVGRGSVPPMIVNEVLHIRSQGNELYGRTCSIADAVDR